jgi:hypothetical protein
MGLFEYCLGVFAVVIFSLFLTLIFGFTFSEWIVVFTLYELFYGLCVLDEKKQIGDCKV